MSEDRQDILAARFLHDQEWKSRRPTEPQVLEDLPGGAAKEIAHFSWRRLRTRGGQTSWDIQQILIAIRTAKDAFQALLTEHPRAKLDTSCCRYAGSFRPSPSGIAVRQHTKRLRGLFVRSALSAERFLDLAWTITSSSHRKATSLRPWTRQISGRILRRFCGLDGQLRRSRGSGSTSWGEIQAPTRLDRAASHRACHR